MMDNGRKRGNVQEGAEERTLLIRGIGKHIRNLEVKELIMVLRFIHSLEDLR